MRIIAIGSHYDDIELGCAGTLLQHIRKNDIIFYAITNSDEFRTGDPSNRDKEQYNALNFMKVTDNIPTIYKYKSSDTYEKIVYKLDILKPDILFVPWQYDTHQSHVRASLIGQSVGRKRHIETYFYSSGSTYEFYPNIFNPINFSDKRKILECFRSQIECRAINIDIIEKREAYWASIISISLPHAEGFMARKVKYSL